MKTLLCGMLFCCATIQSTHAATTWHVGASRQYTTPSAVSNLVRLGDTVQIDAGVYTADVCRWTASHLVIQGIGGRAELRSQGLVYGSKAIWVVCGDSCQISNINFYDATCPDANGAGIRLEGHRLSIDHCEFTHNQDGILCGALHPSTVNISHCEFNANGAGDGYSHNLYIGNVDTLIFEYNYSHSAKVGHELKSRANVNIIRYNRISNESDGTASRNIDLPNGGTAVLVGNEIEQGSQSQNSNMIEFGLEGLSNPGPQRILLSHNTLVNDLGKGSFVQVAAGSDSVIAYNNLLAGNGSWISGASSNRLIDKANTQRSHLGDWAFVDASIYNYQLSPTSPAIDSGVVDLPTMMQVDREYLHPMSWTTRCSDGKPDLGAHELCSSDDVPVGTPEHSIRTFPNPCSDLLHFTHTVQSIELYSAEGRRVLTSGNCASIDVSSLNSGIYLVRVEGTTRLLSIVH